MVRKKVWRTHQRQEWNKRTVVGANTVSCRSAMNINRLVGSWWLLAFSSVDCTLQSWQNGDKPTGEQQQHLVSQGGIVQERRKCPPTLLFQESVSQRAFQLSNLTTTMKNRQEKMTSHDKERHCSLANLLLTFIFVECHHVVDQQQRLGRRPWLRNSVSLLFWDSRSFLVSMTFAALSFAIIGIRFWILGSPRGKLRRGGYA